MSELSTLARLLDEELAGNRISRKGGPLLTRKQIQEYSISKVIGQLAGPGGCTSGFEHDVAIEHRASPHCHYNFFVPFDVGLSGGHLTRDLFTGDFSSGGALVPTVLDSVLVPLLRNKAVAVRLGATVIDGLTGNFVLPRQTSATQPTALPEISPVNGSQPTFDQIEMRPRRISAKVTFSRQLVLQSTPAVEALLRRDLMDQIGLIVDHFILTGQGANSEPLGIMNTPGVGVVTFGGTASWSSVLSFEEALAANNADVSGGRMAYVTTPATRNRWKQVPIQGVGQSTTYPIFIWQRGNWQDGSNDGTVNDYRAAASNNIPNDRAVYGNWPEVIVGFWGNGIDLISDPFTSAASGEINLTCNLYMDVAVRHPQSFAISADSGAQ